MGRVVLTVGVAVLAAAVSVSVGAIPANAGPSGDCEAWESIPTPTEQSQAFQEIDGLSATDFWAVGSGSVVAHVPTIYRWDGSGWSLPAADRIDADLYSVDIVSPDDAWAVGDAYVLDQPLAMRWDGERWAIVPMAEAGPDDFLRGVSAVGPTDVWAAGYFDYDIGLIEHWDGTAWSIVPHEAFPGGERFWDVVALAPDDAWAVGERAVDDSTPMIQHWDGTGWANVDIPHASSPGVLWDVDASAPDDVWAVGTNRLSGGGLVFRWDGTEWRRVNRTPYRDRGDLFAVSVLAGDDVWVAGAKTQSGPPAAAHWDGRTWTFTPGHYENSWFNTIKAFSHTEVWVGGGGGWGIRAQRYVGCP